MNISDLYNPYDYQHPVTNPAIFAGRDKELEEIRYYLDQAKSAPRPTNIALLGRRAAGKTSIMNIIQAEAASRGFCAARVDLDEEDAESPQTFFFTIFDAILSEACDRGAFGGRSGRTYDVYLDMTHAFSVPEDKSFCPFLFPMQYAKARAAGHRDAPVSEASLKSDLKQISDAVGCPFVVLIEEANVLAHSKVHLQKLRNTFMNMPGYMLVVAGTPDMFEVMDDVFSPIVRDFQKIRIDAYKSNQETRACITKPLERIGLKYTDVFDQASYYEVQQIHDVSGGKPYEIQMICHVMFRRLQTQQASKMRLDFSVLEEVREQLEKSQDISVRPILTTIRNTNKEQLSALSVLTQCEGHVTFDQLWALEWVFRPETNWTRQKLAAQLEQFIANGTLTRDSNGVISFAGDDFDRIYVKYYSREQRIALDMTGFLPATVWAIELNKYLESNLQEGEDQDPILKPLTFGNEIDVHAILTAFMSKGNETDIFVEYTSFALSLYREFARASEGSTMHFINIMLTFPWLNLSEWYIGFNPSDPQIADEVAAAVERLDRRIAEIGGRSQTNFLRVLVPAASRLEEMAKATSNKRAKREMGSMHADLMVESYTKHLDSKGEDPRYMDVAARHASLACLLNPKMSPSNANNVGYLFLALGDYVKARSLFVQAIQESRPLSKLPKERPDSISSDSVDTFALASYNLGILEFMCGSLKDAATKLDQCLKRLRSLGSDADTDCLCLWVPVSTSRGIEYVEKQEVDLRKVAREAKQILVSSQSHTRE